MPLQVSYKKQFTLMVMLLVTLLIVVEIFANIWLYNFYRCDFEQNKIYNEIDEETKRKICVEGFEYDIKKETAPCAKDTMGGRGPGDKSCGLLDERLMHFNSYGFRGPEFSTNKLEDTFRIFVVGGSAAFGSGTLDNQTFPHYLQETYDNANLDFKVEVINAAKPGHWSSNEVVLIKNRILDLEPDLLIVYDGWNDLRNYVHAGISNASPTLWKNRWMEICELGNQQDFDIIISLQPIIGTGKKILTQHEYLQFMNTARITTPQDKILELYPTYKDQLDELKNHCTLTADLRAIFDNVEESIYFDRAHTGKKGNRIIADNFYQLSLPIVMNQSKNIVQNKDFNSLEMTGPSTILEINDNLDSKNFDYFLEQSYSSLRDIIFPYKTPKVFSLIFEN